MRIRYVLASAALTSVLGTIERIKQQGEQKAREYDGQTLRRSSIGSSFMGGSREELEHNRDRDIR